VNEKVEYILIELEHRKLFTKLHMVFD